MTASPFCSSNKRKLRVRLRGVWPCQFSRIGPATHNDFIHTKVSSGQRGNGSMNRKPRTQGPNMVRTHCRATGPSKGVQPPRCCHPSPDRSSRLDAPNNHIQGSTIAPSGPLWPVIVCCASALAWRTRITRFLTLGNLAGTIRPSSRTAVQWSMVTLRHYYLWGEASRVRIRDQQRQWQ